MPRARQALGQGNPDRRIVLGPSTEKARPSASSWTPASLTRPATDTTLPHGPAAVRTGRDGRRPDVAQREALTTIGEGPLLFRVRW